MKYKLDMELFGDHASLVDRYKPHETNNNAKFNIKVRSADLGLMDRLAELTGRSRASLLNDIVENILERMLQASYNDDKRSAALLAAYADMRSGKYNELDGWTAHLPGSIAFSTEILLDHLPSSDKSDEMDRRIKALLEAMKK
jgi:hypothetical protein